ncbi:AbrB/MazE/SpoVT family DNA-binding domain-containing protein [Dehalococcoides mccartyi]|uniref:AbrB/MazE/SpoVT family DNA-binding domain-containing protein n=1 Tax=Dehalococcoides mccartyi TaxID=61435 RepID=UPI00241C0AC0|nr:AbrB/MazE/SpoVT family DNA-binding domain-containing protein [Dehalococcoides mccartyi]
MPLLVERKLFKIGEGGFAVTLPKAWINYHRLKPGDTVEVVVDGDLIIRVKVRPEEKLIEAFIDLSGEPGRGTLLMKPCELAGESWLEGLA